MFKEIKLEDLVIDLLGPLGKKINGPIQEHNNKNTTNKILKNAQIFICGARVWYGDIDIFLYRERLKCIANFCNKNLIIIKNDGKNFEIYTIKPNKYN